MATRLKKAKTLSSMTAIMFWPNGMGETPCTPEYLSLRNQCEDRRLWLLEVGRVVSDDEDWNRMDIQLNDMLTSGKHVGESVKY